MIVFKKLSKYHYTAVAKPNALWANYVMAMIDFAWISFIIFKHIVHL